MTLRYLALAFLSLPALSASDFPTPHDNQPITSQALSEAKSTVDLFEVPEGFQVKLFAAEPEIRNPIAMTWDSRGRMWVAENYTYSDAKERFDLTLRDRILIFEDKDGDGKFDERKVFAENLQMLTSVERGQGGIYAMCPPHLLWIPDANGDDIPDGEPVVLLDGFSVSAGSRHTFANGLKWGPDGWLYGRIGISSTSYIDLPGVPQEQRQPTAGGIWRYHPIHKIFEPVVHGTTNPWGMDWDKDGNLFFINTVIGHLWQGIHGAHFKRMHGEDPYPFIYEQIDQHADHYHWDTGKKWTDSRESKGLSDELGGGHAHIGMMIYQGVNWPKSYRDKLFTINMHGRRVNVERLERQGSGFVGKHEPDMLKSKDFWFRGLEIQYGPDGGVYLLDWSDVGECHENDGVHRNSGRIYKVTAGVPKPVDANLQVWDNAKLLKSLSSDNEWIVRQARWELRERLFQKRLDVKAEVVPFLETQALSPLKKLMLQSTLGVVNAETLLGELKNPSPKDEAYRAFLVRTLFLDSSAKQIAKRLGEDEGQWKLLGKLAAQEQAASVRLIWASALQKLPREAAFEVAKSLLQVEGDSDDHNLPLMLWYGIRSMSPQQLASLFESSKIQKTRALMVRRLAEDLPHTEAVLAKLFTSMSHTEDLSSVEALVQGLSAGLKGLRKAQAPKGWQAFAAHVAKFQGEALALNVRELQVLFGDGRAMDEVRLTALNETLTTAERTRAVESLIEARDPELEKIALQLLSNHSFSVVAVKALVNLEKPELADRVIGRYQNFYPHDREVVLGLLTQRKIFAERVLKAVVEGKLKKQDLQVIHARQIQSFGDEKLNQLLKETWGELRPAKDNLKAEILRWKSVLTPQRLEKAEPVKGRVLFNSLCMMCHKLYGEGNLLGPDLTGSGRHDLSYLLENVVDPNGTVSSDYQVQVLHMKDGRVLSGIVASEDARAVTLKMVGQESSALKEEIAKREKLAFSMMPEGMLSNFSEAQVADLIAYLMSQSQVPLP